MYQPARSPSRASTPGPGSQEHRSARTKRPPRHRWVWGVIGLILIGAAGVQGQTPKVIAGPVISPVNGHTYFLLEPSTWRQAEAQAIRLGGHLATIRDQAEQDWLFGHFGLQGGEARNLWIGLHDPDESQNATDPDLRRLEFVWASGEPVTYSRWVVGEPNNFEGRHEFFVNLWLPGFEVSGQWNDLPDVPDPHVVQGVVETTGLEIQCPPDTTVACSDFDPPPSVTGEPTVITGCALPGEVRLDYTDQPDFSTGFGTLRTWIATDPCGNSATCEQRIAFDQGFDGFITSDYLNGGLVGVFTAQATAFVSAAWTLDGVPLSGGTAGVSLSPDGSELTLDFSVYQDGAYLAGGSRDYFLDVFINTRCTGGNAPNGGTLPPLYTLSRSGVQVDSSNRGPETAGWQASCGTLAPSSQALRLRTETAGLALLRLEEPASARLLVAADGVLNPTFEECGRGTVRFPCESGRTYFVYVDGPEPFRVEGLVDDRLPPRINGLTDQSLAPGATTGRFPFQVSDPDSPLDTLVFSLVSDHPGLIPPTTGMTVEGTGRDRVLRIAPAPGQSGSARVSVTVTDPDGGSHTVSMRITVPPSPPAAGDAYRWVGWDTVTGGHWPGTYGEWGAVVMGATDLVPGVSGTGQSGWVWADKTQDRRAPARPQAGGRVAGCWYAADRLTVHFDLPTDRRTRVALYFVDWDRQGRSQKVTVRDPSTGAVLDSRDVGLFDEGVYLICDLQGRVDFEITNASCLPGANVVVSGLFLGQAAEQPFRVIGEDRDTRGDWRVRYGNRAAMVMGVSGLLPEVEVSGQSGWVWAADTADSRAPVHPDGGSRTAGCWFTPDQMTLRLGLPVDQKTRVALYFVDWDNLGRRQQVTVTEPSTGRVLAIEEVRDFQDGVHLVWDLQGPVQITIRNLLQPRINAVLSAVLLGDSPASPAPLAPPGPALAARRVTGLAPRLQLVLHREDVALRLSSLPADGWTVQRSADLKAWESVPLLPCDRQEDLVARVARDSARAVQFFRVVSPPGSQGSP